MSQKIILNRTQTPGNSPADLLEGELAVNTHDGKLFFKRNNGISTIEQIFVTDAWVTGSLLIHQSQQGDDMISVTDSENNMILNLNAEGVLQFKNQQTTPMATTASIMYDAGEYYLGYE